MGYTATEINGSPVYASLQDLKAFMGVSDLTFSADETAIMENSIEVASRSIEKDTNRFFHQIDDTSYKFTGNRAKTLPIYDFRTITGVIVDGMTYTEGVDYEVYQGTPTNQATYLLFHLGSGWFSDFQGIQISGDWGWQSVPMEIHFACLNRARFHLAYRGQNPALASLAMGDMRVQLADADAIRKRELLQIRQYIKPTGVL
jgi:hypothetical protein